MKRVKDALPDVALITGAGLVAVGCGIIYFPTGLIVGGGFLIAAALLMGGGDV